MTALHPHPVACSNCGCMLQATYAEANNFCCPECGEEVCYICGCTAAAACVVTKSTRDKSNSQTYRCGWSSQPGACSFCYSRIAYEFYQEAIGLPADDAFYMSLSREPRAYKSLAYGV